MSDKLNLLIVGIVVGFMLGYLWRHSLEWRQKRRRRIRRRRLIEAGFEPRNGDRSY